MLSTAMEMGVEILRPPFHILGENKLKLKHRSLFPLYLKGKWGRDKNVTSIKY